MTSTKKIAIVFGLIATLGGAKAFAGTWSGTTNVASVEIDDTGSGTSTYLSFTSAPTGKPACGTSSQVIVGGSTDNVKAITAAAMSAFLAGRDVKMWWDGTCSGTYARFTLFTVQ